MRKAILFLVSMMLVFGLISCQNPSTSGEDDFENQTQVENSDEPSKDNGQEKEEQNPSQEELPSDEEQETVLDLGTTKTYSMFIGESIELSDYINEYDVYYDVQSGEDVISYDGDSITATFVGTAILKAIDWGNENHYWVCTITVTAEGFTGSVLDYKMIGTWYYENSYIELNSDKTGYMKVYLNGSLIQDCSFNWITQESGSYKFLTITNGDDYINKDYTILKVSEVEFRIKGYLGFGMPQETTWMKK